MPRGHFLDLLACIYVPLRYLLTVQVVLMFDARVILRFVNLCQCCTHLALPRDAHLIVQVSIIVL